MNLKKLSNNLVKAHTKDMSYLVDYINNGEKCKEIPIIKIIYPLEYYQNQAT